MTSMNMKTILLVACVAAAAADLGVAARMALLHPTISSVPVSNTGFNTGSNTRSGLAPIVFLKAGSSASKAPSLPGSNTASSQTSTISSNKASSFPSSVTGAGDPDSPRVFGSFAANHVPGAAALLSSQSSVSATGGGHAQGFAGSAVNINGQTFGLGVGSQAGPGGVALGSVGGGVGSTVSGVAPVGGSLQLPFGAFRPGPLLGGGFAGVGLGGGALGVGGFRPPPFGGFGLGGGFAGHRPSFGGYGPLAGGFGAGLFGGGFRPYRPLSPYFPYLSYRPYQRNVVYANDGKQLGKLGDVLEKMILGRKAHTKIEAETNNKDESGKDNVKKQQK